MSQDHRLEDLIVDLRAISERIEEMAFDLLREAVDSGAQERPALEKPLHKARRAVERAIRALDPDAASSGD